MRVAFLFGILAALSACAGPQAIGLGPDQIALRWPKGSGGLPAAEAAARRHCAASGQNATLVREWADQAVEIAQFVCSPT
jgi:hypothetical protein